MPPPPSRPPEFDSSHSRSGDAFASVQLPLEEPPSDYDKAVRKLKERPADELRQARKHHRRALKALRDGAYNALSEGTREQLVRRFHTNLKALNDALNTEAPDADASSQSRRSTSTLFRKALTWLW
jgi:hypothetical protein